MGQDHNCMQLYILLITQSGYFRRKKCRRFRAGYKLWMCGEWCGLHPARKRSNRGLGDLEDSPQLNTSASMCAGLSCAAVCECEAARTRKVPPGRPGASPPMLVTCSGGAVAVLSPKMDKQFIDCRRFFSKSLMKIYGCLKLF